MEKLRPIIIHRCYCTVNEAKTDTMHDLITSYIDLMQGNGHRRDHGFLKHSGHALLSVLCQCKISHRYICIA